MFIEVTKLQVPKRQDHLKSQRRIKIHFSQELVVDRYPDAVSREFGIPVGSLRWGPRVRDPEAMDLIRVGDVVAMTDRVLRKSG